MRRFHSYGPVDCKYHFCVNRKKMIEKCTNQLTGMSDEGGHFFTIWAPRQAGKTWMIRQSIKQIKNLYGDRFLVGGVSMQGIAIQKDDNPGVIFFETWSDVILQEFAVDIGEIPGKISLEEKQTFI